MSPTLDCVVSFSNQFFRIYPALVLTRMMHEFHRRRVPWAPEDLRVGWLDRHSRPDALRPHHRDPDARDPFHSR